MIAIKGICGKCNFLKVKRTYFSRYEIKLLTDVVSLNSESNGGAAEFTAHVLLLLQLCAT